MSWSGFRNRKDGPQQGTLFDVRGVPSQSVDSPGMRRRGRRAEMMSALPKVQAGAGVESFDEVRGKIEQRRGSGDSMILHSKTRAEAMEKSSLSERADLVRKIGNETTLTPEHLEGIGSIEVGTTHARGSGATAEYLSQTFEQPPRLMFREEPKASTIAHEVGHHVSIAHQQNRAQVGVTRMARLSTGEVLWPAEEGRAYAFMYRHTVGDPESSYAKISGFASGTEYGDARDEAGVPLTPRERQWAGLPAQVLQPDLFGER